MSVADLVMETKKFNSIPLLCSPILGAGAV